MPNYWRTWSTFISVTWLGAKYLQLPNHQIPTVVLAQNLNKLKCPVLVHLPGRNLNKERMLEILNLLKNSGIKHVLALQGDWVHVLEKDDTKVDFPYASDLVSFIKGNFGSEFCVGVTAYPDLHPHCEDLERDLDYLKKKISLGAEFILTQAVFDFDVLENYAKSCRRHGINVPIFVGVFIIKSYQSLKNMAKWCEFKVPQAVLEFLENNRDDPDAIERFGLDFGENLIRKILENKELFAGVHLYSMNDMEWMEKVLDKFKYSDDASSSAKMK
ncbi:methylenetetrahydrofolate reductase-like [Sitophilus oryzae]|uniref:Methylenetetrahydrofolate reductase-like n=1 Tax=Sitophilus oryzae TaxID=7048 RepID=A0A6J2YS27_SITOR|nr:methylenetetrahydrofolate reductase-like [Sitophilus oryzae]